MGATTDHALGRNLKFFCKKESAAGGAYGTASQEALAGGDAAKVLASSIEFTVTRSDRMDSRASRSVLERITGKQEVSFSCESYLLPAGGTEAPDIGPLIEAAMGGTFGAFSTNAYKLSDSNALPTCRIARTANGVFREDLFGAYVEEMSISASGGEEPRISFSGGAFNYALTGTGAADGACSTTSALSVHSGEGVNFMLGSVISLNSAERTITAKTGDNALTINSDHSWSNDAAVTPSTYTETTSGIPINGISGSLTLNSVTLPITAFDMTLTNNIKPLSDEAFEKGTSDFVAGFRSVTGTVTVRARKDFIKSLAQRYVHITTTDPTFSSVPIMVTLGGVATKKVLVAMSTCELDFGAIDVPEAEEAILNIPFTSLGSSGGDELTLLWNQS